MSPRSHVTVSSVVTRLQSKVSDLLYQKAAMGLIEEPTEMSDGEIQVVVWPQAEVDDAIAQIALTRELNHDLTLVKPHPESETK